MTETVNNLLAARRLLIYVPNYIFDSVFFTYKFFL